MNWPLRHALEFAMDFGPPEAAQAVWEGYEHGMVVRQEREYEEAYFICGWLTDINWNAQPYP